MFVARLCIAIHSWGVDSNENNGSDDDKFSFIFWREGILSMHDDGFFLLESFTDQVKYILDAF